jgi:tetratricopeptide (TPR) repeat protein
VEANSLGAVIDGGQVPAWAPKARADAIARNTAGVAAMEAGANDDAARAFAEALAGLAPGDDDLAPALAANLGLARAREGDAYRAIAALIRAVDGHPDARAWLVRCLEVLGRAQEAEFFRR